MDGLVWKWIVGGIVGALLIGVMVAGAVHVATNGSGSDGPSYGDRVVAEAEAFAACQQTMSGRLRSPGSASYPDQPASSLPAGEGYVLSSYVDSQNGFGALVRTNWTCSVGPDGSGGWVVKDLVTT